MNMTMLIVGLLILAVFGGLVYEARRARREAREAEAAAKAARPTTPPLTPAGTNPKLASADDSTHEAK